MVRSLLAVSLSCAVVVSCSDSDGQTATPSGLPSLGAPFNCRAPIDVIDVLPDGYEAFADVVALPDGSDVMQGGRSGPDNDLGSRRAFSKMGLLIRPGTSFQIHVGPVSQGNALIHWGNAGNDDPVGSIAVESCSGDPDTWIVFPGGVWTLEPACVELIVLTDVAQEPISLPISTTCS